MASIEQAAGGCGCPGGCATTITGVIRGCGPGAGKVLPGATVAAHDSTSGGAVLATTTTDSAGAYTLSIAVATPGNSIVVVITSPRMVATNYTVPYAAIPALNKWTCGATTTWADIQLLPDTAAGYHCNDICALPLKSTLHASASSGETFTLTWSGSRWDDGPGGGADSLATNGAGVFTLTSVACVAHVDPTQITSLACPPSFSVTYFDNLGCFESITITE